MKLEDQIKALAELDGWTVQKFANLIHFTKSGVGGCSGTLHDVAIVAELAKVPNYLTSYDAIIPLVQKCQPINFGYWDIAKITPSELCEALLRACGKWTE